MWYQPVKRAKKDNFRVESGPTERYRIALSGIEDVHLYDFLVTGTHVGVVDWDPVYGGHIPNGNFCMHVPAPVSQYSGFQSATKMAKGRVPGEKAKVLKNKRIDSYHCP